MGKQGPCCHCGVTSTPLWRNGPPEKPVLCNACGSRWRTKGTLTNYIPLHARLDQDEVNRVPRAKNVYINKNKEVKLVKNNTTYDLARVVHDNIQSFGKVLEEDTSNRSSSGSAISFSESCAQIDSLDASELTGPHQSNVWDSVVPSKKRTCIGRPKQSPIEKLTKDLYAIMHKQQSSYFSGSSEDLIFESETPMVSVEIGHGSVLIRHPSSIFQDEESEASSLTIENKPCPGNEVYSHSKYHSVHNESKSFNIPSPVSEKSENSTGEGMQKEQVKKNELQHETAHILESPDSLLCSIDLNDVLNFELFSSKLSDEEQQQLLKYLSSADSTALPDSLQDMFESHQLKESISSLQQRLAEGVFDLSFDGKETDDSKTLKRLKLSSLSTAEWVEQYHLLKKQEDNTSRCLAMEARNAAESTNVVGLKRSHETLTQNGPETKTIKSPKRIASYGNKEFIDNDGSCFSPRQLFALPSDGSSSTLHGLNFVGESSDQDLLLEVPSNGSFPQAELLNPTLSYDQQANTGRSSTYRM